MASISGQAHVVTRDDSRFIRVWAILALLSVLWGFLPTWFGRTWMAPSNALPLTGLVWAHGLVFTGWIALFATQLTLMATENRTAHMRLGKLALVFLFLLPVTAFLASLHGAARHAGPPPIPPESFLLLPLTDALIFPVLVFLGWKYRRVPFVHKRMMALVTLIMIQPATGRAMPGPIGLLIFPLAFLLALAIYDRIAMRQSHPVVTFAYGVAAVALVVPTLVWAHPAWVTSAEWLIELWRGIAE